jgi:hypothetical protein
MRGTTYSFLFCILSLLVFSCSEDDSRDENEQEPGAVGALTGSATHDGTEFKIKGGMLDEKSDSLYARRTFEFKISTNAIHQTIRKVFEMYISSDEAISIQFKLTSNRDGNYIQPGTYSFSDAAITDANFPEGLVLRNVTIAGDVAPWIHKLKKGTVTIDGEFPKYNLSFSFESDQGVTTGNVSGEFITRASWEAHFAE